TANVEDDALLAGVVPPVVEAAVGVDLVVDEGAAPPSGTAAGWLHLDHPSAAVRQKLARPLILAVGQLDHGESVVDTAHRHPPLRGAAAPRVRRPTLFQVSAAADL